jgi:cytidylate kinase
MSGQGILRAVTTDPTPNLANPSPAPGTTAAPGPRRLVVALDGPSSSGKSTVGAEAARQLGYRFCDTGLLYRAVAWLAVERGIAPDLTEALVPLAQEVQLIADTRGRLRHVEADGRDVTAEVHGPAVDRAVSDYAKVPELRAALVSRQRALAADGGIIMAGRDIGTVILPNADIKIYLDASPEERARRRAAQRKIAADESQATGILEDMRRRDAIDSERKAAPLRIAEDAVVLKTDGNTFEESVAAVVRTIREAGAARQGKRGR